MNAIIRPQPRKKPARHVIPPTRSRVVFLAGVVDETDVQCEVWYTGLPEDLEVTEVLEVHPSEGGVFRIRDGTLLRSIAHAWVGWLNERIEKDADFRARVERKIEETHE